MNRLGGVDWLGGALFLAGRTIVRLRRRYLLMALTVAAGLAVYFLGVSMATVGREELVSRAELALPAPVVARVPTEFRPVVGWRQVETGKVPVLGDPASVTDSRVLDRLNGRDGNVPVRKAEPGLALDALTPLGRTDILFLVPGGEAASSLVVTAGRLPEGPGEIALPAGKATRTGLGLGDGFVAIVRYPWSVNARRNFRVVGLFSPASVLTDVPVAAFVGGETTFGPLAGRALLTGESLDPARDRLAERQRQPGAAPAYANLLFLYPAPGRSVAEVEAWLPEVVPPAGFWSSETPRLVSGRIARDIVLPVTGVMFLVFVFTGVGVFATALLSFLDRKRELAVYKAIGLDGPALGTVLWLEMAAIWLVGLGGGMTLAWVLGRLTRASAVGSALTRLAGAVLGLDLGFWSGRPLDLAPGVIASGALASALVLVVAAAVPLALATRANVSQLVQGGRIFLVHRRVHARPVRPGVASR